MIKIVTMIVALISAAQAAENGNNTQAEKHFSTQAEKHFSTQAEKHFSVVGIVREQIVPKTPLTTRPVLQEVPTNFRDLFRTVLELCNPPKYNKDFELNVIPFNPL